MVLPLLVSLSLSPSLSLLVFSLPLSLSPAGTQTPAHERVREKQAWQLIVKFDASAAAQVQREVQLQGGNVEFLNAVSTVVCSVLTFLLFLLLFFSVAAVELCV